MVARELISGLEACDSAQMGRVGVGSLLISECDKQDGTKVSCQAWPRLANSGESFLLMSTASKNDRG
jgi:hypothetical protein